MLPSFIKVKIWMDFRTKRWNLIKAPTQTSIFNFIVGSVRTVHNAYSCDINVFTQFYFRILSYLFQRHLYASLRSIETAKRVPCHCLRWFKNFFTRSPNLWKWPPKHVACLRFCSGGEFAFVGVFTSSWILSKTSLYPRLMFPVVYSVQFYS